MEPREGRRGRQWLTKPGLLLPVTLVAAGLTSLIFATVLALLDALSQATGAVGLAGALAQAVAIAAMFADILLFTWVVRAQRRQGLERDGLIRFGRSFWPGALAAAAVIAVFLAQQAQLAQAGDGSLGRAVVQLLFVDLRQALRWVLLAALLLPSLRGLLGSAGAVAALTLTAALLEYLTGLASMHIRQTVLSSLIGMPLEGTGLQTAAAFQQGLQAVAFALAAVLLTDWCAGRLPAALAFFLALQVAFGRLLPGPLSLLLTDLGFLPRFVREHGAAPLLYLALAGGFVVLALLRRLLLLRRRRTSHAKNLAQ